MISVQEAQQKILRSVPGRPSKNVPLSSALGKVLARRIISPYDLPLFDNSAMDGYAIRSRDTREASAKNPLSLPVTSVVAAGDPVTALPSFKAARIFTGGIVPSGADTVIRQEEVVRKDRQILIDRPVEAGRNIRYRGEEVKKGACLLEPGSILNPAAIGLLASVGLTEVPIISPPKVGILVTGSEIVTEKKDLMAGKIFDSNSFALAAALEELRLSPSFVKRSPDTKEAIRKTLSEGFKSTDFLIVTGGVSVGDFDFVKEVASRLQFQEVFWKVKQKPGKPIWFGKKGKKFLFGLPGNPASVLVCFYEYVRPALLKAMGANDPFLPRLFAPLNGRFEKKAGATHFLKGRLFSKGGKDLVEILEHQGSHMMTSFAGANCLVVIPEGRETLEKGEEVEVHFYFA